jgi:hypothetical protein
MTKEKAEEAIQVFKEYIYDIGMADGKCITDVKAFKEALDMAIKALEQGSCEDAISRADAVKVASGYCHPQNIANELAKLPSVTPQPKTGKWVNKSHTSGCGITFVESECTCCGKKTPFNCDEFLYRYCPNCGAKMVELQESEDKK